jgi:hypothetical protein
MVKIIKEQASEFRTNVDKLIVAQMAYKSPAFYETGKFIECSQQPTTGHDVSHMHPAHSLIF